MSTSIIRLGVLISGGGRTLLNLHNRIKDGSLPATIDVVVGTRTDLSGVDRARARNLPVTIIDPRDHRDTDGNVGERFHAELHEAVGNVDLVCMAGFLALWRIPHDFMGRVINIHPALLPDFGGQGMYGLHVHRAVLAAGKTVTGCTVHFCDNEYDHGPIILQREVPVLPGDTPETLAQRVFEQECIAYPQAVTLFAQQRIRLVERRVEILEG